MSSAEEEKKDETKGPLFKPPSDDTPVGTHLSHEAETWNNNKILTANLPKASATIDLDDLFSEIYYSEFLAGSGTQNSGEKPMVQADSVPSAPSSAPKAKRSADIAGLNHGDKEELTEQQRAERRERNREHAKRSRLRKKFLLESLQEQIHGLEEQVERFKSCLKKQLPSKAEALIKEVVGDKEKYTPLPMPSGFGPVKTLMEPDFRLSTYILSTCSLFLTLIQ